MVLDDPHRVHSVVVAARPMVVAGETRVQYLFVNLHTMTIAFMIIIIAFFAMIVLSFSNTKSFPEQKTRIMNMYSSVLSDMNIDFTDGNISATNITNISTSIQNLADELEKTGKDIKKESIENQKWLLGIIEEFNTQLRIWIDRHTDELESLESEISLQNSEKPSEKAVLELVHTRLENHRIALEKI